MTRNDIEQYITLTYNADAEHPWAPDTMHTIFRHSDNRKWFAAIMNVAKEKLVPGSRGSMDILNVKCDPIMIGSVRSEPGIFPAWHMNKDNWVSIALDGTADDDRIKLLLDLSFELTAKKPSKRRRKEE